MYNQNHIISKVIPENTLLHHLLGGLHDLSLTQGKSTNSDLPATSIPPSTTIDPIAYILMVAGSRSAENLTALSRNPASTHDILGLIWDSAYVQRPD